MTQDSSTDRAVTWLAPAGAVAVAILIRIPSLISPANITFDEGVYASSVRAMRSGAKPFIDIFSSQGPFFLPMLRAADAAGFGWNPAPRLAMLAAAVALTVAVYVLARGYAAPLLAAGCAGLVAVSGTALYATAPMQSDGIALAFGVLGILVAVRAPVAWAPWLAGALLGAGVAVKSLHVIPCIIVVAAVLLSQRRWAGTVAAAVTGAVVVLAASAPWGFERVWEQYVVFHLSLPGTGGAADRIAFVTRNLIRYDGTLLLAVAAAAVAALIRREPPARSQPAGPRWLPVLWLTATVVVLIAAATLEPGFTRAVGFLIPPLALLVAQLRPDPRLVILLAVVAIPLQLGLNPVADTQRPDGLDKRVIEVLRGLPAGVMVVTDQPGLAWQAHRDIPAGLTDPSSARIAAGDLTADDLVAALRRPDVCAYMDWSGRFRPFAREVDVAVAGWDQKLTDGRGGRLLVRPGCAATTATAEGS